MDSGVTAMPVRPAEDIHPRAEYMNPRRLMPFREHDHTRYRNGFFSVRKWDEMRDSVLEVGFRSPVSFRFNHETGRGYVDEGCHRVGIAHELNVPVPVVVHRYGEDHPAMGRVTEPGQYSMRDANGYSKFPTEVKPSDIGLVVAKPELVPLLFDRARDRAAIERVAHERKAREREAHYGYGL